jgi:mono/diheme cytochrome c family protein
MGRDLRGTDNAPWQQVLLLSVAFCLLAAGTDAVLGQEAAPSKFYRIIGGKVDAGTYNGFQRYHAGCNHCHGPDGMNSTFGPSLVDEYPISTHSGASSATAKAAERRS